MQHTYGTTHTQTPRVAYMMPPLLACYTCLARSLCGLALCRCFGVWNTTQAHARASALPVPICQASSSAQRRAPVPAYRFFFSVVARPPSCKQIVVPHSVCSLVSFVRCVRSFVAFPLCSALRVYRTTRMRALGKYTHTDQYSHNRYRSSSSVGKIFCALTSLRLPYLLSVFSVVSFGFVCVCVWGSVCVCFVWVLCLRTDTRKTDT